MAIVLTKSSMPVIKWVAEVLGWLMNGIYYVISKIGAPNVALAIVLFTLVLLLAMTPLQIKQQRFSKLNNLMAPELKKVQGKYKGKNDQVSQQKMMDETNAIYAKYGVSPTGSCVQMLIQLPVMFALYQVIYKIPGYITMIGDKIGTIAGNADFVTLFKTFVEETNNSALTRNFSSGDTKNIIDAVYGLSTNQWDALMKKASGMDFESTLSSIHTYVHRSTNFLGLSISDTPLDIVKNAWADKAFLVIAAALLFPILAWLTQWLNFKLMPQPATPGGDDASNQMANTMKSMNNFMPLMSAFFCLTLPVGVGIYWIMSAVIRSIQQLVINRILDSESTEEIISKAQEKANKKRARQGLPPQKITSAAHASTRSLGAQEAAAEEAAEKKRNEAKEQAAESTEYYKNKQAKAGSIASKANMVKDYDEKYQKNNRNYKK